MTVPVFSAARATSARTVERSSIVFQVNPQGSGWRLTCERCLKVGKFWGEPTESRVRREREIHDCRYVTGDGRP